MACRFRRFGPGIRLSASSRSARSSVALRALPRIVTRGLNTPRQRTARVLETGDIITLPAVHGDGQTIELAQRLFDIHADGGETLFSQIPRLVQVEWSCAKLLSQSFLLKLRPVAGNFMAGMGG